MTIGEQARSFPWLKSYPPAVDYNADIPVQSLPQFFCDAADKHADRAAFDFLGRRHTYRELGDAVARASAGFRALGVGKGTRVALLLPNCPYYVIAFFGVLGAGGTVVNFNPLYTEREIAAQLSDSGASILVTLDIAALYAKAEAALETSPLRTIVVCPMAGILPYPKSLLYRLAKRRDTARPPRDARHVTYATLTATLKGWTLPEIDPYTDVAVLQYTGGTTGLPKGAMLTHANLYANAVQATMWFDTAQPGEERVLAVIPFFHVFGMTAGMLFAVRLGAELVALPRFDLGQVLKTIARTKPTIFPAVPTIYNAIVNHADVAKYDLSSIKYCISGGAPLPVEVKESFERLTGCHLVEGYGLSETSPIATVNPIHGAARAGSIGLPVPGTVIEIVSLEDRMTVLPPGERGEVCITGPQVMAGYWNQPGETADAMQGGRFHTGDIGTMDADGFTYIVDRLKDIIIAGGFKIYPRIVEEAVYQHPDVEECIAAGVPDPYRGQTVKLWVKPKEGRTLDPAMLKEFLKPHLSAIELPKIIEFRDKPLPKTLIGKLSRKAVLEEEGK